MLSRVKKLKVKRYSSSIYLRATSPAITPDHTVLPSCHSTQVNVPYLTPARTVGTTPEGWKAELTEVVDYIPRSLFLMLSIWTPRAIF